jgi:hypothetical protein
MAVVGEWAWVTTGGLDFDLEAGDFWADVVTSAEVMPRIEYYPDTDVKKHQKLEELNK